MSTFNSGEPSHEPWKVTADETSPISIQGTEPVGTGNAVPVLGAFDLHRWRMDRKAERVKKRRRIAVLALLLAALAALSLSGCATTSERSLSNSSRTQITERHPTPDGGYVEKVTEYTEGERSKETTTKADVDWGGAVLKAGAAAATGDWGALGGIAATIVAAGGAAYVQQRRIRRAEQNEDETYQDLKAMKSAT